MFWRKKRKIDFSWVSFDSRPSQKIALKNKIHSWWPLRYSGYQSHAPSNDFFPFLKVRFGGRQSNVSMTITMTISMSILRVAELLFHLYLTLDKQKLRSKTYKIVGSPFSFVSLTGNVLKLQIYKLCTTTTTSDWTKLIITFITEWTTKIELLISCGFHYVFTTDNPTCRMVLLTVCIQFAGNLPVWYSSTGWNSSR